VGELAKVNVTVRGSSRSVFVSVRPPASVAVSRSSRYDGYSWSGVVNDPVATPDQVWIWCVWQFDGQCCTTSSHCSAAAPRLPCCGSLALPENEIVSPTFHVVPAVGVRIVAVGGVLFAVIAIGELTVLAPCGSLTRNRTA